MLSIFYGNTGTGKSYALMDKIKKDAQAGRRICVVVPDQFTFEYERMLYEHMGCSLFNNGNTEVLSFSRLTADIFRHTHALTGNPADTTVKTALMYKAVKETAKNEGLEYFNKQAKLPSFTDTVLTMISELTHSGVTPSVLGELVKTAPDNMKPKLCDLFLIFTRYHSLLGQLEMRDAAEDTARAAEAAAESGYFDGMCLYMDEFKSFTGDQYDMIRTMLSQCDELTVCMTADLSAVSGRTPFSAVNDTCAGLSSMARELHTECRHILFTENKRFKAPELTHLAENLLRIPFNSYDGNASAVNVVTAADIYGECSYICSEIRRLVCEENYRYRDIVILSRQMNEDIDVLSAFFDRYDIPFYCDRKPAAHHKPLMLMISAALELIGSKRFSTEALLRYTKTGLTEISPEQLSQLENYCYKWDIDGEIWDNEFPDKELEEIKLALLEPVRKLKSSCIGKTGAEICRAIRSFIAMTGAERRLMEHESIYVTEAEAINEKRDNERICSQLDQILASLEAALPHETSISEFREIFMLSAAKITLSSPPDALDGVHAQQSDLARLTNPKIVFVMHANDGIFPFVTGESTTFSEKERSFFKNAEYELSGSMLKRMEEERFNAFKAVTAPSQRLYISCSRTDHAGKKLYPSMLIDKLLRCLPQAARIDADKLGLLFYCRTPKAAYTACTEGFDPDDSDFFTVKALLCEDKAYKDKFDYISNIDTGSRHLIRDRSLMKRMYGNTLELSASRFEDYRKCPFMYFCKTGLKLEPLRKVEFDAMNRGNIMHLCLQKILENNPREKFLTLTAKGFREQISTITEEYVRTKMNNGFAKSKDFDFFIEIMKDTLVIVLCHMQEEMSISRFEPVDFELPVGVNLYKAGSSDNSPIILTAEDGSSLNFTGTVDRVDIYTSPEGKKYIRIIDYKSGRKDYIREQLELGINLQMFLYLFALTEEGGKYSDCSPAGVLYFPVVYPKYSKQRIDDDNSRNEAIQSAMKMKGEVVYDTDAIAAMDPSVSGKYVPVKMKKDGGFYSNAQPIKPETLQKIKQLYTELMTDMCSELYNGNIPAEPLENKRLSCNRPCNFCDYRTLCHNYPDTELRDISQINHVFSDEDKAL